MAETIKLKASSGGNSSTDKFSDLERTTYQPVTIVSSADLNEEEIQEVRRLRYKLIKGGVATALVKEKNIRNETYTLLDHFYEIDLKEVLEYGSSIDSLVRHVGGAIHAHNSCREARLTIRPFHLKICRGDILYFSYQMKELRLPYTINIVPETVRHGKYD